MVDNNELMFTRLGMVDRSEPFTSAVLTAIAREILPDYTVPSSETFTDDNEMLNHIVVDLTALVRSQRPHVEFWQLQHQAPETMFTLTGTRSESYHILSRLIANAAPSPNPGDIVDHLQNQGFNFVLSREQVAISRDQAVAIVAQRIYQRNRVVRRPNRVRRGQAMMIPLTTGRSEGYTALSNMIGDNTRRSDAEAIVRRLINQGYVFVSARNGQQVEFHEAVVFVTRLIWMRNNRRG